jgi:hypothetical protein
MMPGHNNRPQPLRPLDPALVKFVEALADAAAERDHRDAGTGRRK